MISVLKINVYFVDNYNIGRNFFLIKIMYCYLLEFSFLLGFLDYCGIEVLVGDMWE